MKVIFLDFDGVINNINSINDVDLENVKHLSEIIKKTKAKIVVTSSTKYSLQRKCNIDYKKTTFYKYVEELKKYNIETYDITPYIDENRELEIIKYLKNHPEIKEFLILDDDYIIESLKENQVFLDLYKGITEEHINPAINILNGDLGFYPSNFDFNESLEKRLIRINKNYKRQH